MDLNARLDRLSSLRRPVRTVPPARHSEPPLEDLLPGRWVVRGGQRCFVVEETYHVAYAHGSACLGQALEVPSEVWASLPGEPRRSLEMPRAAFLDIETTGLARGAGTYAFLVGVGRFEHDTFRLRQFFMPGYAEEEALLEVLAEDLSLAQALVTFNGRTFDWPIIESRYTLARRPIPCVGLPHLDLLPLSRRLWRRTLYSCALSSLEQHVLGVERSSADVPGWQIPQLYVDYVERGLSRPMADVFYHNAVDVLSMVALAARAAGVVGTALADGPPADSDLYSLGRVFEATERIEQALSAYRMALESSSAPLYRGEAAARLAMLLKRLGRIGEAVDVWRWQIEALQQDGRTLAAYVELAKAFEHRLRDDAAARDVVNAAIAWCTAGRVYMSPFERRRVQGELAHRLARLERRLDRVPRGATGRPGGCETGSEEGA